MPPMPTVLIMRYAGGTPAVHRLAGGTSTGPALDGTFGTAEGGTPSNASLIRMNRATEFKGFIYVANFDTTTSFVIRRRPVTGGAWTTVHTVAANGGSTFNSGMYVVNTGGGPTLATLYRINTANPSGWQLSRTTNGGSGTWTNVSLGAIISTGSVSPAGGTVYRGQLIFPVNGISNGATFHVDVATGAATNVAGITIVNGHSVCVFKNRLFMVVSDDGFAPTLYELVGGTWQSRGALPSSFGGALGSSGALSQSCIQAIGDTKMVAIYLDVTANNTNFHWKAVDITVSGASFVFTAKNLLVPANLQLGGGAASKQLFGWASFTDNETMPGTPTTFFWSWGPGSSAAFVYYEYINSDSELLGSTLALQADEFALVHGQGGGERINTSDVDLLVDFVSITQSLTASGRSLITVIVRGAPGISDKFLRGYFNTLENPIMQQMQLAGVATGGVAVRNGNQVEQVEANPAITYTFEWAASAQGVFNNQPCRIQVQVATE